MVYNKGCETLYSLLRKVVDASSLKIFQVRLDGALSNLGYRKMSWLIAVGAAWTR